MLWTMPPEVCFSSCICVIHISSIACVLWVGVCVHLPQQNEKSWEEERLGAFLVVLK